MAEGTPIGALAVRIGADATDLIKGFGSAAKAADKLDGKLADVAHAAGGLATVAAGVATSLVLFAKGAADVVDELGKMSQKVGVSVESLSALKFAAQLSDVSLDQLGTGLKQLNKNMADAQAGTGDAKDAFKALGLTVTDAGGQLLGTEEQLLRIADKFAGMQDGAGKTALAMKMFGKAGADLIPLLNQGRAGIEELRKEAERLGLVFSTEAAKAAEQFNDNLTRLKGSAQGLTIHLAGPFVKAFGDASQAMLDAKKNGEGFFATIAQGLVALTAGSDSQRWQRELIDATDALMKAQNELDRVKHAIATNPNARLIPGDAERVLAKYIAAVAKAQTEVDRLMAIKPMMAPDETGNPAGGSDKPPAPLLGGAPDEEALKAAREAYLKLFAIDEEARKLGQEFLATERAKELEEAKKHYEALLEARRLAIENEAALEAELPQILDDFRRKERENEKKQQDERMGQARTFLGAMSGLMNTNSKKMFEIGKKAAIAETIINTYAAAMGAYKALASIPIVGPALGAAAAAAAVLSGMAQVQNIRNTQIGTSGGAAGVFPASPITGEPVGTPGGNVGGSSRGQTTTIKGINPNDLFTGGQLRKLLEGLNETMADGGRIVIA